HEAPSASALPRLPGGNRSIAKAPAIRFRLADRATIPSRFQRCSTPASFPPSPDSAMSRKSEECAQIPSTAASLDSHVARTPQQKISEGLSPRAIPPFHCYILTEAYAGTTTGRRDRRLLRQMPSFDKPLDRIAAERIGRKSPLPHLLQRSRLSK